MKDKIVVASGLAIVVLVLLSLIVYIVFARPLWFGEIAAFAVVIILVAFGAYVVLDRARSASRGLPAADERLRNVNYKAGYYWFIAAIWSAVFAPVLAEVFLGYELGGGLATAVVVIVSGFVFAVSYLYLARKGA